MSADGSVFAACMGYRIEGCRGTYGDCHTHRVMAWNVNECQPLLTQDFACSPAVGISADGRQVAVGGDDGTVRLWNLETASTDRPQSTAIEVTPVDSGFGQAKVLALSEDQSSLLVGYERGMVELWGIQRGRKAKSFGRQRDGIWSLAFQPFSTAIATTTGGVSDYKIRFWDTENGRQLKAFEPQSISEVITFSSDGKLLAANDYDQIQIIDVESRRIVRWMDIPYDKHASVQVLSFSPDASALFGFRGSSSFLWDVDTGRQVSKLSVESGSFAKGSAFVDQRTVRFVYSRPLEIGYELVATTLAF